VQEVGRKIESAVFRSVPRYSAAVSETFWRRTLPETPYACLEEVLTSLDHDARDRLGIKSSPATSLSFHPELAEAPAVPDAQRDESLEPVPTEAR
jgi:hypothetical protein